MRTLIAVLILLCGLLAAPGLAAQLADDPGTSDRAAIALQRAVDHYQAGKLNEAAGLLRGFVVSQTDPEKVNTAYLYLARVHADLNEPGQALQYLEQIPAADRGPAVHLLQGRLLVADGQTQEALNILLAIDAEALTFAERQTRWLALSEGTLRNGEPERTLFFLYRALLTEGEVPPNEILARAHILLDNHFSAAGLREVSFAYAETPFAYQAMLKLGWRALAAGQPEVAQEWLNAVHDAPPGFAYREEALSLQAQLTDPSQVQRAIGVLLPLSGRYAAFGQLVQRGMQLAEAQSQPVMPVRFIYRDTAGDPDQAARQLAELAISDRVMAVAGPLVGAAATTAAERANRERLTMLTLSQKEGLAASSLYVFRNSLTARLQVRTLVDAAYGDLGLSQFAILAPQTRQGELFAELFRQEILERGGELVAQQSYDPQQTDFRREVRLLLGLDPNAPDEEESEAPKEGEQPVEEEPPPFQALFMPDYADRISLIAPQLAFYGLENVQLLGTNGWNDPELLRTAGRFIDGALITDGFFRHSPYVFVQEFVERYFEAYGEEPTILEAQGYDTAGILLSLLDSSAVRSREDLRRALTRLQHYPGVTGATSFNAIGDADKVLYLLQVQNGTFVQVE